MLEGPGYTLNELKAVQDWVLERQLKTVPGVIDVTGFGGTVKQYQVLVDPWKLGHYGITLQQVEDAISKSNANIGGDILSLGPQSHNVRGIGLLGKGEDPLDPANAPRREEIVDQKLEEISNVVITQYQGTPILVSHVAKVVEGHQPRLGIIGRDAEGKSENDVVQGIVLMRKYEKSLGVSEGVEKKIEEIQKRKLLPPGMRIKLFNQRTELVHVTTHNVRHNLLMGMGLVIAILFIFLGDLASAGIVAIMIPLALLFSITVLYLQDKSANLLSIGAVDFGIIVDSSTIIVENIYRHITAPNADRSRPLIDRIIDASTEIERALFFSTTIIVCAFIPLFSMTGPEGALFGPMANTYAFAICGALLLAVTLAPVLCSFFFVNKREATDTFLDKIMKMRYLQVLYLGAAASRADPRGDGITVLLGALSDPSLGRDLHAPAGRGLPLDSGHRSADRYARVCRFDRSSSPRIDRLGSRGRQGDLTARPPRRRDRSHQLLQPGIRRPLEADGRVAKRAGLPLRL